MRHCMPPKVEVRISLMRRRPASLRPGSHQDPSWAFLQRMRGLGHAAADRWLAAELDAVGTRSMVDLSGFAGPALEPSLGTQRAEAA